MIFCNMDDEKHPKHNKIAQLDLLFLNFQFNHAAVLEKNPCQYLNLDPTLFPHLSQSFTIAMFNKYLILQVLQTCLTYHCLQCIPFQIHFFLFKPKPEQKQIFLHGCFQLFTFFQYFSGGAKIPSIAVIFSKHWFPKKTDS